MSFYGNITSNPLTTYDKIYSNRVMLEENAQNDGVLPGRQVLIEYDTTFEMPADINITEQDKIYIKEQLIDNYSKNAYLDKIKYSKNYDSTIWRKEYYKGNYKYTQVAELNGVGFKTIEFQKNNIPQVTVEGNEANTLLTLNAGTGIQFKSYADNKNVGVENSLQFKSLDTSQLYITSSTENDEIILFDPMFNYGSSSPELSIGEGNFNFDATKIPAEEVNEYFTLDYDAEKGYYYKNYTEFYDKNGKIIEITALLKGKEVYIKTDSGKLKLLGIVYSVAQPMTYNLRNRTVAATVDYIISSKTYVNQDSDVNFKYSLTSDYVLTINMENLGGGAGNYRLGGTVPSDLKPYLGSIRKVEINSPTGLAVCEGLDRLDSENWLTQLTKVEEINLNIKGVSETSYSGFDLYANCLPSTSTLKSVNFNFIHASLEIKDNAVGNLGCSKKTILNLKNFTVDGDIDDPTGKFYAIQKNGVLIQRTDYWYHSPLLPSGISFDTICHINPDVEHLKIQELDKELKLSDLAIHVNALKDLPNLRTIDFGEYKGNGTLKGSFKSYIVSDFSVTPYNIIKQDIFPHRQSCPKLSQIKNLHVLTDLEFIWNQENDTTSSILSDDRGYIVSSETSLEFVSRDINISNFNAEIYAYYCYENDIESFKKIERFSPYSFGTNSYLLNIDLPPKLTTLPKDVFQGCKDLKAITRRNEINQLVSIERTAINSGVKIYYDGTLENTTYKTFLKDVGQDNINISNSYKEALYFLYQNDSLIPQAFKTIQQVPEVNVKYKELYTPFSEHEYAEGDNIDTTLNTRILYTALTTITLTIKYGQNYCKTEEGDKLINNQETYTKVLENLGINNTRWSNIIDQIDTQQLYHTYYSSTNTELKYKEDATNEWKTISSLSDIIPFTENKTIYLSNFLDPLDITFTFREEKQIVASYVSNQYKGWAIDLKDDKFIREKIGYKFKGWQGTDIKLLYNSEEKGWSIETIYNTKWDITDDNVLTYAAQADTVDKEDILFPIFELIDVPTQDNIILTNPIGVLQGNLLHLYSIPLSSFMDENNLYLTEVEDYLNNTTKSSKFLGKEMIGYGYDLSHSSLGSFKIKIKNNTINSYYLNEDEEEIRLNLEEIARRKGKEYLRYSITGILKEAKE